MEPALMSCDRMHKWFALATATFALGLSACEEKSHATQEQPIRVALGDCAAGATRFQSGPRPRPFHPSSVASFSEALVEDLDETGAQLAELRRQDDPWARMEEPRPRVTRISRADLESPEDFPEMESEEGDDLGVPMALEEAGRPGAAELDLDPSGEEFVAARRLAIEEARHAGILSAYRESHVFHGGWLDPGFGFLEPHGFGLAVDRPTIGLSDVQYVPAVRIDESVVTGALDRNLVRRRVRSTLPAMRACHARSRRTARPKGTMNLRFAIEPDGSVSGVRASGLDTPLRKCVTGIVSELRFPATSDGRPAQVRQALEFTPTHRPAARSPRREGDSAAAGLPTSVSSPIDEYQPGTQSPLASLGEHLETCLRASETEHGVFFVELHADAEGQVTDAHSVGLDDAFAAFCVSALARTTTIEMGRYRWLRCPVAFGDMPTDDALTIDVRADGIWFESARVASLEEVADASEVQWKVSELFEPARRQSRIDHLSLGHAPIAITGPHIVRPDDAMPMKVLARVFKTVFAAGGRNWALAARQGDSWRLLHSGLALPVAPVPVGTGEGWWLRGGSPGCGIDPYFDEPVHASILIAENAIWVGVSRLDEFHRIERVGTSYDWSALRQVLGDYRQSRYFSGRTDIEIAGDDQVTYRVLVQVIDLVNEVGFTGWGITDPSMLSAIPRR